jgi:hypothetical protein
MFLLLCISFVKKNGMCNEEIEMFWPSVDTVPSSKEVLVRDGITSFPCCVID